MVINFTRNDVLIIISLALPKFITGFITTAVIPIFPALIRIYFNASSENSMSNYTFMNTTANYNYQQLSILYMIKNILQIILSPFLGCIIECFGALLVLVLGTFCHIIMIFLYGLGNVYFVLIIGRIFEAISSTFILCATFAYTSISFRNAKEQGFVFGITGLILTIGSSLGPVYGGCIYENYGKKTVFLSILTLVILECIFSAIILCTSKRNMKKAKPKVRIVEEIEMKNNETYFKESMVISTSYSSDLSDMDKSKENIFDNKNRKNFIVVAHESKRSPKTSYSDILLFFKDIHFLILLGAILLVLFSLFLLYASLPLYMSMKFNATESQQGIVWISSLLGYVVGFIIGNLINTRFPKYEHIFFIVNSILHAAAMLSIPFIPILWSISIPLSIVAYVFMVFEIVKSPILVLIVKERHSSKFGILSGIVMMTVAISSSLGSYLGPVLLGTIGYMYTNIGICVINIFFLLLYVLVKRICK